MNWYNYAKKKVGLGGWSISPGVPKIYRWKAFWTQVNYHFVEEGIVRIQVSGKKHKRYGERYLHTKVDFKYDRLKCQLLALDKDYFNEEIYYPPEWWEKAVSFYKKKDIILRRQHRTTMTNAQRKQYALVEKYINKEVQNQPSGGIDDKRSRR